jgi:uroporphyrinogen-III synthase
LHQASELADQLRARGLEPVVIPTIEQVPPTSFDALDAALAELARFDWIVFTSANAVTAFADRAAELGRAVAGESLPPIAAIGPATARAVTHQLGVPPSLVPEKAVAESLAESLLPHARRPDGTPARFLLPRAEVAREVLPEALQAASAVVIVVPAYRTVVPAGAAEALQALFTEGAIGVDAIAFTSSSTAQNLAALLEVSGMTLLEKVRRISIGPVTSATMRDLHMPPHAEAAQSTIPSLVDCLVSKLS